MIKISERDSLITTHPGKIDIISPKVEKIKNIIDTYLQNKIDRMEKQNYENWKWEQENPEEAIQNIIKNVPNKEFAKEFIEDIKNKKPYESLQFTEIPYHKYILPQDFSEQVSQLSSRIILVMRIGEEMENIMHSEIDFYNGINEKLNKLLHVQYEFWNESLVYFYDQDIDSSKDEDFKQTSEYKMIKSRAEEIVKKYENNQGTFGLIWAKLKIGDKLYNTPITTIISTNKWKDIEKEIKMIPGVVQIHWVAD